jgi:hypothetical protein
MTRPALAALVAVALCGCAAPPPAIVPAEGVALLNNEPLPNARVEFVPMTPGLGAEYIATGTTDEKGRFTLTCKGRSGACAGENRVTVTDADPPDDARGMSAEAQAKLNRFYAGLKNRPIPAGYGTAAQTPLVVTVAADRTEYRLELKR